MMLICTMSIYHFILCLLFFKLLIAVFFRVSSSTQQHYWSSVSSESFPFFIDIFHDLILTYLYSHITSLSFFCTGHFLMYLIPIQPSPFIFNPVSYFTNKLLKYTILRVLDLTFMFLALPYK